MLSRAACTTHERPTHRAPPHRHTHLTPTHGPTQPQTNTANRTGPEVLAFLQRELPQCAVDKMVSPQEAERFAQSPGGTFPRPQYALEAQQVLAGGRGGVVLLVRGVGVRCGVVV